MRTTTGDPIEVSYATDPPAIVAFGKSETERAEEIKRRAVELLEPFLRLKDEAAREGFLIECQFIVDALGRPQIVDLHLIKRF